MPNVRIEVTRASHAAIHAVEKAGGSLSTVYHTRRGMDCLLHPERHAVVPPFERPILEKDVEYYSNPMNRGYLSDRALFTRHFQPRGYVADEEMEQSMNMDVHHCTVRYTLADLHQRLDALKEQRNLREYLRQKGIAEAKAASEKRDRDWKDGKWFPEQGEWKWVEVHDDGQVETRFAVAAKG